MARSLGAAATVAGTLIALAAGGDAEPAGAQGADARPNVVVIMSDDQTQDSMRYMPRVQSLIGARGATFPNSVINWPLCCPSRATFLTGQYAHNHQVLGNQPPNGGFDRLDGSETLPVWLQRAGYHTAHIGKFLNGYENSVVGVPPGWSEWHGSKQTYVFYGYELLEDGQVVEYGSNAENPDAPARPETYSTDVYTDKAVELIGRRAPEQRPFFLSLAYLAPHIGGPNPDPPGRCNNTAKPAARHIGAFAQRAPAPAAQLQRGRRLRQAGRDRDPPAADAEPARQHGPPQLPLPGRVAARHRRGRRTDRRRAARLGRAREHADRLHLRQRLLSR